LTSHEDGKNCHRQYLDRDKNGYCGLGGTGVTCPGDEAPHGS
jgi:peptide-methionine (S)-S-oxide reductase